MPHKASRGMLADVQMQESGHPDVSSRTFRASITTIFISFASHGNLPRAHPRPAAPADRDPRHPWRPMPTLSKTILLLSFAFLWLTAGARAQAPADTADAIRTQLGETLEMLELSDQQREPVEAILRRNFEARLALMEQYGIDPADPGTDRPNRRTLRKLAGEMKDLREDAVEQLETVLTPEQMERWTALEKARQDQMRERMQER